MPVNVIVDASAPQWAHDMVRNINNALQSMNDLPVYSVSTLPKATRAGIMIYVSNEAGGGVPAFCDGVAWRRVTDRAIVS
jgi:hypothetical protein